MEYTLAIFLNLFSKKQKCALVLWLCSHFLFSGSYFGRNILSPVISFECAVLVNFCSSYFLIWKDRISHYTAGSFFRHYGAYNLSCTGTFLVKMGLLQLVVLLTRFDVVICNLIALCFSGLINFALNDKVIFKRKKRNYASDHRPGIPGNDSGTEQQSGRFPDPEADAPECR